MTRPPLRVAAGILAFAVPALFAPPYALCSAVTLLAVLVPLHGRLVQRPFADALRIGDALAVSAGLLALRAELLPPWSALSVLALIATAFVVARGARSVDHVLLSFPSHFSRSWGPQVLVGVAAATVAGGWWSESGRASLDLSFDSLPVAPASGSNQFAKDPDHPGKFFIDPMVHRCPHDLACTYVVEHQCLSVEGDLHIDFVVDHDNIPTCPILEARRVPQTGALIATSREVLGPNSSGWPRGPYRVANGRFAPLVPLAIGATGAPALWRGTAVAGVLASAAFFVVLTSRRRRAAHPPAPLDPYRVPAEPRTEAEPEDPWLRYARLVLAATTLPCVLTLVASLGYGTVSFAAGLAPAPSATPSQTPPFASASAPSPALHPATPMPDVPASEVCERAPPILPFCRRLESAGFVSRCRQVTPEIRDVRGRRPGLHARRDALSRTRRGRPAGLRGSTPRVRGPREAPAGVRLGEHVHGRGARA